MAIHHVGDAHARVEIVEDSRSTRSAPGGDAPAFDVRPVDFDGARVLQRKAETPLDVEADQAIAAVGLNVQNPLAAGTRQQPYAAHLASARDQRVDARDRARIAVAIAAAQVATPPRDGAGR